uniref:(northern house mosquito) hypothetical protein n=1 Tax=Culex pipiens TaxID=7175 RepID=A0A8D8MH36_CULPI
MSSKERFCTYGYVYAAFGIISSVLHMMGMNSHYAMKSKDGLINEAYHIPRSAEVSSGLFSLVFFIILIVGIYQKKHHTGQNIQGGLNDKWRSRIHCSILWFFTRNCEHDRRFTKIFWCNFATDFGYRTGHLYSFLQTGAVDCQWFG